MSPFKIIKETLKVLIRVTLGLLLTHRFYILQNVKCQVRNLFFFSKVINLFFSYDVLLSFCCLLPGGDRQTHTLYFYNLKTEPARDSFD